ncbi:MAG: glutamine-hydrolyzing GMP synthase [Thermodesulfobacterium sp. 37_54]|uniref:GMP synthase [glutamine-hydrolyzing] n=1 Tax=Thermodesulfobacterium commune TaxID=1741 RepID=A0A101FJW2_9BACT|nr:MAG: glutamine-hydrolyzing GMP synthase [Thermodesulfobacterium sp. 37_54]KUK19196.1 MAG: GMP synthase [Thermodesulfobacterium commune]KUK38374.1 MAG: GMP synthase [Thermodesulfobacterium commune]HAA83348.1 GMP synthase (glutamine-hydrolyzing) [Thermodesulfobacterium commune]HBT04331.1 GMP synthase (glutamine-hydrolyzing) [Thermodesulfobacterium commune]
MIHKILVLDFGSQTTQLIARRIRELGVYSEIKPCFVSLEEIKGFNPSGIILSGGPSSVYDKDAPMISAEIFELGIPILGICYGLQLISYLLGGKVERSEKREFGPAYIKIIEENALFKGLKKGEKYKVWMSHSDKIEFLPEGFYVLAETENTPFAAVAHIEKPIYGVQFHPEVVHTEIGQDVLRNFVFEICGCTADWSMPSFIEKTVEDIKNLVKEDEKVICALSGGIDSTVTALLVHKAIGDRLIPIFVNNGLLRKNEPEEVLSLMKSLGLKVDYVDASSLFLERLKGVEDPEKKRKIIGETFIEVFEKEAKKFDNVVYLAQGTLYPDVIESVSFKGPSATIKSHHNVGGLPERMHLKLIEPLRELFKDEVRKIAELLGLPKHIIWRQPFPGPGLAIRIIGEVSEEKLDILREADSIVTEEMLNSGWYYKVWQSFAVLLPVKTVGVMGDARTYEYVVAIRCVESQDAMTADWVKLPYDLLERLSNRIINEVKGVNRVVYDISSKPPATIEWE